MVAIQQFYENDDLAGFIRAGGHVQQWYDYDYNGILPPSEQSKPEPISRTKKSIHVNYGVRLYVDVKAWRPLGWNLPGNGRAYDLCGHIWYDEGRGCLRYKDHSDGLIYVRLVGATCFRAECPVCYQKWAAREAGEIETRFKRLSRNNAEASVPGLGRPIHVVVSVPECDAHLMHDNFKQLRKKVYALAKRAGVKGGCAIFHPYANDEMHEETPEKILIDKSTGEFDLDSIREYYAKMGESVKFWYVRPHFHLIGYAPRNYQDSKRDPFNAQIIKAIYDDTGYVVKNLGVRQSVRNTAHYQLSHCGVKAGVQTVTWFGQLSNRNYSKLNPLPKPRRARPKCPECNAPLQPVLYRPGLSLVLARGTRASPLDGRLEGGYWVDPGGWRMLRNDEKLHSCIVQPELVNK